MRAAHAPGFSVMELAVVIAIVGILVGFAVPRFVSLETQARVASRDALAGSVRSAAALARALWLATGQPAAVEMDGVGIAMVNGYPRADSIDDAVADYSGFRFSSTGAEAVFAHEDKPTCAVTYTEATSPVGAPVVAVSGAGSC